MSSIAPIKPQDVANQLEQEPKGASIAQAAQSKQAEQSTDTARAEQELSAPEVIDDNSAELNKLDYYDDDEADDDSGLIEIVRYRLEHPAPTIRVTLDELLTL